MKQQAKRHYLATNAEIHNPHYRAKLKIAVDNIGIGQRDWLTAIQDACLHVDMQGDEIWVPAEVYPIPLVDDVIAGERYIRDFMRSEACEFPERDKLIDLYFRIMHPQIARHFGR
jgi:hypothetical protein